ncbi:MAG: hypothetical protein HN742_05560 [Lentisphaerae bacterium]|jgi:hypothetical protein|nr:hypothetical protein [Lentisphaerota bacterium]MBT5607669.1 hypothetical protein [Lentisphaerota bacterium]MBT7055170.1 hypothetical protein [Lentisphaerota bacterium]MBT7841316.1 hypothetical protein [Lentisphaerota bacterium]
MIRMSHRLGVVLIVAAVFAGCGCVHCHAQESGPNLLPNGGFEDGIEAWAWGQWKGLPEPGYLDTEAPYRGKASYTMTLAGVEGERMLYATIGDIDPDADYELTLALRGRDLSADGVGVALLQWGTEKSDKPRPQGWITWPDRPAEGELMTTGGTFPWTPTKIHIYKQSIKLTTTRLALYIRHKNVGTGELSIDGVSFRTVPSIPFRASAHSERSLARPAREPSAPGKELRPGPAGRKSLGAPVDVLVDRCDSLQGWGMQLGAEFPGAQGQLNTVSSNGCAVIEVTVDLSKGGRYAGAEYHTAIEKAESILFDVHSAGLGQFGARIHDATGQVHAASFGVKPGDWHTITLPLDKKTFTGHWGGAKDGTIHFPLRRVLVSASSTKGAKGAFFLRNLGARQRSPKRTWEIGVSTNQPGHIHFLGEPTVAAAVRILNRLREERNAPVTASVVDLSGEVLATTTKELRFGPWAPETVSLEMASPGPGYFHVRVEVGSQTVERGEGTFGVVPKPLRFLQRDPESFFGMHSVIPDIAARIGVHWFRYYHFWRYRELHKGLRTNAVDRLQGCRDAGIDTMMCLDYREPSWLKPPTGPDGLPTEEAWQCYADFVRDAVKVHPMVAAFEIQNEPDLELMAHRNLPLGAGVAFYARMVSMLAPIIRAEAPGIPIVAANVSGQDQKGGFRFCRAVIDQVGDLFDVWAPHPYASPRTFGPGLAPLFPEGNRETAKHQETLEVIREAGKGHKYWIGEKGWEIRDEVPLTGQTARAFADCAARSLIIAKSVPGVEKYFWFVLAQGHRQGGKYTLFRGRPLQPMPGAIAYANVAYHLDHANPVDSFELAGGRVRVCVFERQATDTALAALWCVSTPFVLTAELPGDTRAFDLYGRSVPSRELRLTGTPLFVQASATQVSALTTSLRAGRVTAAEPFAVVGARLSDVRTVHLELLNNTSDVVRLTGLADGVSRKLALLPGGETPVPFEIAVPRPVTAHDGKPLSVTLTPRAGKTVHVPIPTNVLPVTRRAGIMVDGKTKDWDGVAPIVIDARTDVLPPDKAGWNGPDDLSMRVSLAWDEENLFLLAQVTDDIHATPNAVQFWKSDAIQIGVDVLNDAGSVPSYDEDDHEYGALVESDGTRIYQTHPAGKPRFRAVGTRADDKHETCYEFAFPWAELGRIPEAGMVFSLNLVACDNDGAGMNYWMGLSPGIVEGKRPAEYRDFYLAE